MRIKSLAFFILAGVLVPATVSWAVTFGELGDGNSGVTGGAGGVAGSWFQLTEAGDINQINIRILAHDNAEGRVALYSDNSFCPGNLIVESNVQSLVNGWNSFEVSTTTLSADIYWLCYQVTSESTSVAMFNNDMSGVKFAGIEPIVWGAFPDPYGTPTYIDNWRLCMYADYLPPTPTSTATPTNSATSSVTVNVSSTHTPTVTNTLTVSPTLTESTTATVTPTLTNSATLTPSASITPTLTYTSVFTPTVTPTYTSTPSITRTLTISPTPSTTITSTISPTLTISPTNTHTLTITLTQTPRKSSDNLGNVIAYPNPWRGDLPWLQERVIFHNLSQNPTIYLYSIDGRLVKTITPGMSADGGRTRNDGDNGQAQWGLTNKNGQAVASGVYIYIITDPAGHKTRGKIALVR